VENNYGFAKGEDKKMQLFTITSHLNGEILYEGHFPSLLACLEDAVENNTNLAYADLNNINLSNANLDDARLKHAKIINCNLSGANLSESNLSGAQIKGCALYNTCLCYSNLQGCDFEDSSFGATDIAGCDISGSRFSTLSCFNLYFNLVHRMDSCIFTDIQGTPCTMSAPPLIIKGLSAIPTVFMNQHVFLNNETFTYNTETALNAVEIALYELRTRGIENGESMGKQQSAIGHLERTLADPQGSASLAFLLSCETMLQLAAKKLRSIWWMCRRCKKVLEGTNNKGIGKKNFITLMRYIARDPEKQKEKPVSLSGLKQERVINVR
jgi:hypothetical protein